jgi:hypothetical protein
LGGVALDKAVQEGTSSLPDAGDLLKDKLIEKADRRERRERLQAEKKRLEETLVQQQAHFQQTFETLRRTGETGGDVPTAQRAWRQAEHELGQTREALQRVTTQLAALTEKPADESQQGKG